MNLRPHPRIGVISDTHGLLRPEAVAALQGAVHVLHAGDVGKPEVLDALSRIAPVTAIRGNVDRGGWVDALPETVSVDLFGLRIYMLHDRKALAGGAATAWDVVVSGHSHKPGIEAADGVLWLNPGAAGPRRFRLPVTVASLWVEDGRAQAKIHVLHV